MKEVEYVRYTRGADGTITPDVIERAEACRDMSFEDKNVARTEMPNGDTVSTVFIGIDPGLGGDPPLLYETMIFDKDGDIVYCDRYAFEEDAREGHAAAIEWSELNGD